MASETRPRKGGRQAASRDERLKAALKANLARRKAQQRARAAQDGRTTGENRDRNGE